MRRRPRSTPSRRAGQSCFTPPPSVSPRTERRIYCAAFASNSSRSMRRIASRIGATSFAPTIARSATSRESSARRRCSPSPRRPVRAPATTSPARCFARPPQIFQRSFARPNLVARFRAEARRPAADRRIRAQRPRRREGKRHHLLQLAQQDRRAGARALAARLRCAALSRGARRPYARGEPGRFLYPQGRGDGGDHRLRHGRRQAGRALHRSRRSADLGRGLLSGDRPRRPRWRAGPRADAVLARGAGAALARSGCGARRRRGRRRLRQTPGDGAARGGAGLPLSAPPRRIRRRERALRQMRPLPRRTAGVAPAPVIIRPRLARGARKRLRRARRPFGRRCRSP